MSTQTERLEFRIEPDQRAALVELAREARMTQSDLVRIGICWVLRQRSVLLTGQTTPQQAFMEEGYG